MNDASACTVYLIRHGETEWNSAGRWQGQNDVPLNAEGRRQAARLARRLADEGTRFAALYASDLSRAWETAEIIGGALGIPPAAAPALREIDLGAWSGKTRDEIARAYPGEWLRIRNNEDLPRGGAGETLAAFQKRLMDWMNEAAVRHAGRTICAVTHGGCVRAVLLRMLGLTWAERDRIPPLHNASLAVVNRSAGRWIVVRRNGGNGVGGAAAEESGGGGFEEEPA